MLLLGIHRVRGPGHHVGRDHAVKAGEGGVEESHRHQDEDSLQLIEGGEHFDHGAHPEGHPADGQEVLQNASVTGPHPAEQGGGFALVTELEELGVGDQVGPSPEPGKEKDANEIVKKDTENLNLMKGLISQGISLDSINNDGETALMIAVKRENLKLVKILLKLGASPDIFTPDGETALSLAKKSGNIDVLDLLR